MDGQGRVGSLMVDIVFIELNGLNWMQKSVTYNAQNTPTHSNERKLIWKALFSSLGITGDKGKKLHYITYNATNDRAEVGASI